MNYKNPAKLHCLTTLKLAMRSMPDRPKRIAAFALFLFTYGHLCLDGGSDGGCIDRPSYGAADGP